jgi:hypothetical protein
MSALTSSFTANLVSVKSAAKKSQKVVVGVQASNEFAKKVRKNFSPSVASQRFFAIA